MMAEPRQCPECGTALSPSAPEGLCPACLMEAGLRSRSEVSDFDPHGPTTPKGRSFVPPTIEELAARFPHLEIIGLLGYGGMGAVYKARQRDLDRLVAIKILPPEMASDPAFGERFTREARALARLNHPHIVTVYDFGQAQGLYFLLMEYVDGVNLRQAQQAGLLTPQQALAIVPQICEALQFAHDEGIVHRDIKPENILMDRRGRIKIADFGLAKMLGPLPAGEHLTQTAQVMGTLHYMAPEQIERPLAVDHRADIYSLGVVFYEMLTGELPLGRFSAPSLKARIDARLDEIVLRALEREPERRYQHAGQMKTAVETVSSSPFVAAVSPTSERTVSADAAEARRRLRIPAIGLLIAGLLDLLPFIGLIVLMVLAASGVEGIGVLGALELLILGLSVPVGITIIVGAAKMLHLQWYGLATTAAVLALVPCRLGWLIGLPFAIWAWMVLSRPEVKAAFDGAGEPNATLEVRDSALGARRQVTGPAIGLIATGILHLLGIVLVVVFVGYWVSSQRQAVATAQEQVRARIAAQEHAERFNQEQRERDRLRAEQGLPPEVPHTAVPHFSEQHEVIVTQQPAYATMLVVLLPVAAVLLSALLMIVGGALLLGGRGYGFGIFCGILALVPWSPAWLVGLPVGIWTLVVLNRSEVKRAFGKRPSGGSGAAGLRPEDIPVVGTEPEQSPGPTAVARSAPNLPGQGAVGAFESRGGSGVSPSGTGTLPPGAGPRLLLCALMLIFSGLIIAAGFGIVVYAALFHPAGSNEFWGWMGSAFGCILGGAGALVGTWNTYRQWEGAGDLMQLPHWTWLDYAMLGFLLLGIVSAAAGLIATPWVSWGTAYSLMLVGAIVTFQGGLFLVIRALIRRAAHQESKSREASARPNGAPPQAPISV